MRTDRVLFGITVMWMIAVVCPGALAQVGRSAIFGTVTDPQGAVVPNAEITVTDVSTGTSVHANTDQVGNYIVTDLGVATYRVACGAPGFETSEQTGIVLQVDQRARVDITLKIGQTQQVVTVEGTVTNLDTSSSTIKDVVDPTRMEELPLNGRNALSLQALLPGSVQTASGSAASGIALNTGLVFSVNGARPNQSAYTLDAGLNMDMYNNVPAAFPNPDMLQEFSILQNSYSSVYGRDAGAVVNMITKSGTNQFHGSAYEYLRNSYVDAKNYFIASQVPPLRRNQFGGTVGGPVILPHYSGRNKTFFFVGFELTRQILGSSTISAVLPTALQRGGNFSQTLVKSSTTGALVPATVAPPSTVTLANPNGIPYPGAMIPPGALDPAAQAFLKNFVPSPSTCQFNASNQCPYNVSLPTRDNQFIVRLDESLSAADNLNARYFFDDSFNAQNAGLPAFNSNNDWPTHNGVLNETHVFSPHLINLATFLVARNTFIRGPQITTPANWTGLGCVGCQNIAPPDVPTDWAISVANGFGIRVPTNFRSYMMNYQFIDTMSWSKGNHLMQFGGEYSYERRLGHEFFQMSPQYAFNGTLSSPNVDGYADFLLGAAATVFQNSPLFSEQYKYTPSLYFQDDWRVSKKLTLNLGARWEPYITTRDRYGHDGAFRPGQQSTIYPLAPLGALFPGDQGIGPGVSPDKFLKISPRVGFAYDPFGDGKTSIRAAYGIFSDTLRPVALNTNQTNQPFSYGQTTGTVAPSNEVPLSNPYLYSPQTLQLLLNYVPPTTAAARAARVFYLPMPENSIPTNFTTGYIQQWNLNVQREIWKQTVITVGYVGSKGTHLLILEEENPAVYIPGQSTSGTNNVNARRPYTNFTTITEDTSAGYSNYNSLQVSWNRRFSHGFTLLGSFVFAKSMDIASNDGNSGLGNQGRDPYNWNLDYGPSDFDVKRRFVTSFVYRIPGLGSEGKLVKALTGGWQVDGILTAQSGTPFTVRAGVDQSRVGVNLDTADVIGPVATYNNEPNAQKIAKYFNTAAYALPAVGTFGTSGRNSLYGPGLLNLDAGLFKLIPFGEARHMELRWETFNTLNHPNFLNPNSSFTSSIFGRISSAQSGRVMQIAAKIVF